MNSGGRLLNSGGRLLNSGGRLLNSDSRLLNSGSRLLNSGNHQEFTENNLLLISPPLHSITLLRTATRLLILPQLTRRVGELPQEVRSTVEFLCLEQLENLGEALLDFTSMTDLDAWLAAYERLFGESLLYFYRNCNQFSDWQAVVIYPSRNTEQSKVYPHRSLLNGEQVHRIYFDELPDVRLLPITVAATVLTIADEAQAPEMARYLLSRTEQDEFTPRQRGDIIDIITSIMV